MSDQENGAAPAAGAPSPLAGVGVVVIVAIAIIGWAVIGGRLFQDVSLFGGFLMLWHYANMEQLEIKRLPQALAGAAAGAVAGIFPGADTLRDCRAEWAAARHRQNPHPPRADRAA